MPLNLIEDYLVDMPFTKVRKRRNVDVCGRRTIETPNLEER
jgi:hypothetical protein